MKFSFAELAAQTGATVETGVNQTEITGAAGLDLAGAGDVAFLANPRYTPQIKTTKAGAIFLAAGVETGRDDIAVLRAPDPYLAYTRALRLFYPDARPEPSVHPSAVIDDSASVALTAHVGANVVIGRNAIIGEGVVLHPNVTLYDGAVIGAETVIHSNVSVRENCVVGARCVIYNNAVIGSDGFGYAKDENKRWLKIPQVGRVVLEDDVEIGAGTTIDCASVGETRIKRGAKIDNLVQIGHSCTVGEDSLICAQAGLAGSSVIGNRVILAGQVGVAGHLTVGDDAVLTAKSATSHDVAPGKIISGIPGFDNREWLRSTAAFRRLGEMARILRELSKKMLELEGKFNRD